MSDLEMEFFIERALLASKDRDSADWQRLMEDITPTGQGVGAMARRLPNLRLSEMLCNSLPVPSEWSREDYLDLFSRTESELGLSDVSGARAVAAVLILRLNEAATRQFRRR
jgi:hypothetical protein